jgi:hypothetical protein
MRATGEIDRPELDKQFAAALWLVTPASTNCGAARSA